MSFYDDPVVIEALQLRLIGEIRDYARKRKENVVLGLETPELAGLLTEKYGYGMVKAAHVLQLNDRGLHAEVNRLVHEIDPNVLENRQRRWGARPAGLSMPMPD